MVRVCFVCLGNICRSPTAAGVMREHAARAGLDDVVHVESAGTAGYHEGEPADERASAEAARRGLDLEHQARQFRREDLDRFDLVVAMDHENRRALERLSDEPHHRAKIRLLREFDPEAEAHAEVPDPYYGGDDGFARVFDLVDAACAGLLDHLRRAHDLS